MMLSSWRCLKMGLVSKGYKWPLALMQDRLPGGRAFSEKAGAAGGQLPLCE
jgi:hypothetical protein